MDSNELILVVILLAAAAIVGFFLWKRYRTIQLRKRFGDEYDRTVKSIGSQSRAERELENRQKRVRNLKIHPLTQDDKRQFGVRWRQTQAYFVDDPGRAVKEADMLVKEVMSARGYPMANFEQSAADISVDHPRVVSNYRAAVAIAKKNQDREADTEELRQAIVYYRELFEDLLEESEGKTKNQYEEAVRR